MGKFIEPLKIVAYISISIFMIYKISTGIQPFLFTQAKIVEVLNNHAKAIEELQKTSGVAKQNGA